MCDKIMEKINIHELVRQGMRNEKKPWEHEKLNIDELVKEIRIEKLKEDNEDLKCEIAALKQDMEEVQHENSNMRALIQTSLRPVFWKIYNIFFSIAKANSSFFSHNLR